MLQPLAVKAKANDRLAVQTDDLTGLALRNAFMEGLGAALSDATDDDPVAVLCLDLDRFKIINDTLGHGIGDQLLKKVADRLLKVSRKGDLVARLGGDEFVILQRGLLEGPLDRVEAAFERIQQDERHGEVSLLALEPITTRSFPNWAMGFVGLSDADAMRFAEIARASEFDPSRFDGDRLHAILRDLALEEERAAA